MRIPDTGPKRRREENVIPMINVVFLLLIFFLMTAHIAPPAALEVTLPEVKIDAAAEGALTLYLGADGTPAFRDVIGAPQAFDALDMSYRALCPDGACARPPKLLIRADTALEAAVLPAVLRQLAARKITDIDLVTQLATVSR